MKKFSYLLLLPLTLHPYLAHALDGVLNNVKVTEVRSYEATDGSGMKTRINIDGNAMVGPNPDNPAVDCKLYTYTESVTLTAIHANEYKNTVDIRYVSTDEGDSICKVRYLAIDTK